MKISTRLLLLAALFALVLPLIFSGGAGAAITYIQPDGAYMNANGGYEILASTPTTDIGVCSNPTYTTLATCTSNSADWTGTNVANRGYCLVCHSASAASPRPPAHQKHSYLLTGHRNMLRKVTGSTHTNTLGGPDWTATNSVIPGGCSDTQYRDLDACTTGGATWLGFCSNPAYYNQFDCTSNSQIWSNANLGQPAGYEAFPNIGSAVTYKTVLAADYYVYGGWYRNIKGAQIDRGTVVSQCSNPAYGTQFDCTSNLGTWDTTSSPPNWYRPEPSRVVAGSNYGCSACHTTGSGMAGAPQPDTYAVTATTTGSITAATAALTVADATGMAVNQAIVVAGAGTAGADLVSSIKTIVGSVVTLNANAGTTVSAAAVTASNFRSTANWYFEGVTCVRCHSGYTAGAEARLYDVGTGHHVEARYEHSTNLCMQCHLQEVILPGETDYIEQYLLAVTGSAAPNNRASGTFSSHARSNMFLNSPHARFSGTGTHDDIHHEDKIGRYEDYNSNFAVLAGVCSDIKYPTQTTCTENAGTWSDQLRNRGCVGCHDVHVSSVDPDVIDSTSDLSNIKNMCQDCHTASGDANATQVVVADINHPTGVGTPMDNLASDKGIQMACVTCHMGPGTNHLFRIKLGGYTINDGAGGLEKGVQFSENGPEGAYPYAIAMDVGLVCGQCHSAANAATKAPGKSFTDTQMTAAATGMHAGGSTNNSDCLTCHTNTDTHHAVAATTVNCVTCHSHGNPPSPYTADTAGNNTCLTCHSTTQGGSMAIDPGSLPDDGSDNHHGSVIYGSAHAFCIECHGATGGVPTTTATDNTLCLSCHADYPTPGSLVQGVNHHTGICVSCHHADGTRSGSAVPGGGPSGAGVLPFVAGDCIACHATAVADHATHAIAHVITSTATATCSICHTHAGISPTAGPMAACATCHTGMVATHAAHTGDARHTLTTTTTCSTCHTTAGIAPTTVTACASCHAAPQHATSGAGLGHNNATLHVCTECHVTPGVVPGTGSLCGSCHTPPAPPVANFFYSCDGSTSGLMNLNAAPTSCPTGSTCTYAWSCSSDTTATTSCNIGTTPTAITLTATAVGGNSAGLSDTETKTLTPCTVTEAPVCGTGAITYSTTTAKTAILGVTGSSPIILINWGDTNLTPGPVPATHTYAYDGKYAVRWTVQTTSTFGVTKRLACGPVYATISPTTAEKHTLAVSALPTYTTVKILKDGVMKSQGGSGTGSTWTSAALPGVDGYRVALYKYGKTFTGCTGTGIGAYDSVTKTWALNLSTNATMSCTVSP